MKQLLIIFALMCSMSALSSCKSGETVKDVKSYSKYDFQVQELFEVNGCKVYRFLDNRYVYFSDCRGQVNTPYTTGGKHPVTNHQQTLNFGNNSTSH